MGRTVSMLRLSRTTEQPAIPAEMLGQTTFIGA
jgi:hypothetical protein